MGTTFAEVIDLGLMLIQDYKLDDLYIKNQTAWDTFTTGLLIKAIPLFRNSKISLAYTLSTKTFDNTLGNAEIDVLAQIFEYCWYQRTINDIRQQLNTMTTSDAKRTSVAQNLKEKSERADRMREIYRQRLTDYSIDETSSWW